MRFFGTYLFEGGRWSASDDTRVASEPWLFLNIYDGDIATVMYRPSGPATGMAFLGITPRSYFDDDSASPPSDTALEARGLAAWWALMNPVTGDEERAAKEAELRRFLAADTKPYDLVNGADPAVVAETETPVELTAGHFLLSLGLPLPDDLRR